ncbi:hypothetical protein FIV42_07040 [Persicimonas caeni]|uniref:Uncharacterized protein n=1 Tax=Persicimonas caeni TaxID=2292766 RepID=A0A4Y6PQ92_PERCE|nr:hypothetical protein [Persicimonas caeni]QDG50494.1 hypothetical protein FIV42_07040 [Persicimonas caeni]QED31715.1 hypothetical protein FRD00_07035 [Persicimonas caeni]
MGVILEDLENEDHDLSCNWWNWRPTLRLIDAIIELDDEMLERLSANACGGKLTAAQAEEVGRRIREELLPHIPKGGRILYDGTITNEPDDGTLYQDNETWKNYSVHRAWLEDFVTFCVACEGFRVL